MTPLFELCDAELDRFMAEDVPFGDLTTRALGIGDRSGRMLFQARAAMTACCTEEAARLITRAGAMVDQCVPSGHPCPPGTVLLTANGTAASLIAAWKVAQTLVETASGIATAAAAIAIAARTVAPGIVVACTRKTTPGTRTMAIKAIIAGGATPHRLGLSDSLLIFPEHRAFLDHRPLPDLIDSLRRGCPERKVVIEVTRVADAIEAAQAGAEVVQLEKFTPDQAGEVVAAIGGRCVVAVAGGVTAGNAAAYAATGAHVLVSSAPYWAKPADVAVTLGPD